MKEYGSNVAFVETSEIQKLRQLAVERDEYLFKAKKAQADFVNYQDRVRTERADISKYAIEGLLKETIQIRDYILMCLLTSTDNKTKEAIQLTDKEFIRILLKFGVSEIKITPKVDKFDPAVHEAISVEETSDVERDIVLEELKTGYRLYERVLRPTLVKVSKPKPADAKTT